MMTTDRHSEEPGAGPEALPIPPTPRPRPVQAVLTGRYAQVEPVRAEAQAGELFAAATAPGGAATWRFMSFGPFADAEAMRTWLDACAASRDPLFATLRNLDTGRAEGIASFLRIDPDNAAIEIGHIWMSPALQRTRSASEAIFLLMDHALGSRGSALGYRRLEWKCDAQNAASRAAALRFGFTYEGTFRQHMIRRGQNRDTAWYSLLDREWPARRQRFVAWLDPSNFDASGRQRRRLAEMD